MKHTFHLVRHGQKKNIIGNPELTELGISQAKKVAQYFADTLKQSHVFYSPLLRTKQTAQCIADALQAPMSESLLLKERSNWGDNPHQTFEEFLAMWSYASAHRDWKPPVGDSSIEAGKRLEQTLEQLAKQHKGTEIILVTHGGIIVDFLRNMFTEEELNKKVSMFSQIFENVIPECSITTVEYEDGKISVSRVAYTDHLK